MKNLFYQMFMLQVCGRRKPSRPSATPPWQGGEFKTTVLIIKAAFILSSNYHNSPPCQGGGGGWVDYIFSMVLQEPLRIVNFQLVILLACNLISG